MSISPVTPIGTSLWGSSICVIHILQPIALPMSRASAVLLVTVRIAQYIDASAGLRGFPLVVYLGSKASSLPICVDEINVALRPCLDDALMNSLPTNYQSPERWYIARLDQESD